MQKFLLLFLSGQLIVNTLFAPKIEISYFKNTNPDHLDVQVKLNKKEENPNDPLLPAFVKKFCSEEFIKKRYSNMRRCGCSCIVAINTGKNQLLTSLIFLNLYLDNFIVEYNTPKKYTDDLLFAMFTLKHTEGLCDEVIKHCIVPFLMPTYELILEKGTISNLDFSKASDADLENYIPQLKLVMEVTELKNKNAFDCISLTKEIVIEEKKKRKVIKKFLYQVYKEQVEKLKFKLAQLNILDSATKREIENIFNQMFKKKNIESVFYRGSNNLMHWTPYLKRLEVYLSICDSCYYNVMGKEKLANLSLKSKKLLIINFCNLSINYKGKIKVKDVRGHINNDHIHIDEHLHKDERDFLQIPNIFAPLPLEYE